ncbi:L-rhamnose mutarotase [Marinoscillum sp. MHG1-6]|uniref:L-rhamnose mutarotase n=1 Tax=Marinoscillum sp. MHG1-6 TaxID=2959627 RepID=UPI00215841AA|nr:L-rhamnose mutarotase [Marinoscillum sp. MHG1-6]
MSERICMGLDLRDDPKLIEEYKNYHAPGNTWPEIIKSIYNAGVLDMEIYLLGNRLFMIMEVDADFSLEKKAAMDEVNPKVQEWEALMQAKFQQALPWEAKIRWMSAELIFKLEA